jgi:hypothetical protein
MTRPLRLEFNGALYHITSRGDAMGRRVSIWTMTTAPPVWSFWKRW